MTRYICRDQPYQKREIKKILVRVAATCFFFRRFSPCCEASAKSVITISCYIYHMLIFRNYTS